MDVLRSRSARCSDGAAFNYAWVLVLLTLLCRRRCARSADLRAVLPELVPQEGLMPAIL